MGKLDGKVAIITGSTSGMGRDTAYLFAKEGAKVVITGRSEARAKEVVEKIRAEGGEAVYVLADASDSSFAPLTVIRSGAPHPAPTKWIMGTPFSAFSCDQLIQYCVYDGCRHVAAALAASGDDVVRNGLHQFFFCFHDVHETDGNADDHLRSQPAFAV